MKKEEEEILYKSLEPSRVFLVVIFLIVAIWYLSWRLETFNPDAMIFSSLLYATEIFGMITALLHLLMTWRLTERKSPKPSDGHSVDVFITTINEPVELLRHTLLASINMDYHHQTWLLDDGNRPEMSDLANELGCRYITRLDNIDAKAGNLNNALNQTQADFIAVFDADHAPHKNFLTHTIGYFQDPKVAFVQAPQDFYNLDSYQHRAVKASNIIWTEQSLFFRVIQRGKDYWNAAFFCGSCAVLRREALEEIGGFATGTVTEDLHTSLKIHKRGYKSVYHAAPLAFGLAPSTVVPYMKQRIRWGQGAMQVWRDEGIVFFARGLTIPQRLNYLASTLTYFDGWQKAVLYTAPVIVLITGVTPINAINFEFWLHFIPYYVLVFWVSEEVNRGYGRALLIEQYNMGRFAGLAWSTLGIFKQKINFSVTPKGVIPKQSVYKFITPQIVILLLNGVAIPLGIVFYYWNEHLTLNLLIANIVWAVIIIAFALSIVLFSLRANKHKRKNYRFDIPLPVRVNLEDQIANLCTIDNISSSGCKIYGHFPDDLQSETKISGKIFLPDGLLSFSGKITVISRGKEAERSFIRTIGCEFDWSDTKQRDYLDLFLYGSDLQWRLNQYTENSLTPLDRIFGYTKISQHDITKNYWSAMLFKHLYEIENQNKLGLVSISDSGKPHKVLIFEPLTDENDLLITIFSPRGRTTYTGKLISDKTQLDCPTSPIYMYEMGELKELEK